MPELPEVETIARDLAPRLSGLRIAKVSHADHPPVFDRHSLPPRTLLGRTVIAVKRAGKFVVIELSGGVRLAVHLRMTGRLIFRSAEEPRPHDAARYLRATLHFRGGAELVFSDVRKFGRLRVFRGVAQTELLLGVDPFDRQLDAARFAELTRKRTTPVKVWLLDQRRLAGVGNIYACEALYYAGVRPKRRVGKLTALERHKLLLALRKVLRKAIYHRGSSVDDYVDGAGKSGRFQNHLAVYGRAGKPCRRCGTPINRMVLGQRGTFYCPGCQR